MKAKASGRAALGILLALLWALVLTAAASAHAELVKSEPAPGAVLANAPAQIRLYFSEPANLTFSEIQVLDRNQVRVDNGDLALAAGDPKQLVVTLKPLADGAYAVVWKVLSDADGHVTRGNFAFSVGAAPIAAAAPPQAARGSQEEAGPVATAVRWVNLMALLALAGSWAFRGALLEPSLRAVALPERAAGLLRAGWRRLAVAAFALALAGHLASVFVQAGMVSNASWIDLLTGQAVVRTLLATRFGALWMIRSALLLALGATLLPAWAGRGRGDRAPTEGIGLWLPGLALGAAVFLTLSLGGHSNASGGAWSWATLADWLHLMAVALWVGGLFHLLGALLVLWSAAPAGERARWLAWSVRRFSALALPATAVIASNDAGRGRSRASPGPGPGRQSRA